MYAPVPELRPNLLHLHLHDATGPICRANPHFLFIAVGTTRLSAASGPRAVPLRCTNAWGPAGPAGGSVVQTAPEARGPGT